MNKNMPKGYNLIQMSIVLHYMVNGETQCFRSCWS